MLFDLKGRRKRFVQVVYVILAVLFGGGLVLFGVGSGVQGGLVDAISGNSGGASSDAAEDEAERYERQTRANPKNERAWLELTRAKYTVATSGSFDSETGQFEEGAVDPLEDSTRAWERYLDLKPKKPDPGIAALMVNAYGTLLEFESGDALTQVERAANAQRLVAEGRPSPVAWFELARIHYLVGKISAGDRAGDKALELTPSDQRNTVRAQLGDLRKAGLKQRKELKKAERQAAEAGKQARQSGEDPFGASPQQTPLGGGAAP